MPTETGIFTPEEAATGHLFSYRLAQFIGKLLPKDKPVLDIGCGPGSYMRYLLDIGFNEVMGIEGTEEQNFEVPKDKIVIADITIAPPIPFYKFNIVCLEVGEHIPAEQSDKFFEYIRINCALRGYVVMSWAIPGQDGTGHVNCQPNEWVIKKMREKGFDVLANPTLSARDVVEPHLAYFKQSILIFQKLA